MDVLDDSAHLDKLIERQMLAYEICARASRQSAVLNIQHLETAQACEILLAALERKLHGSV